MEFSQTRLASLIREIVQRELPADHPLPDEETDLVQTGLLDSMGWIAVLTGIEELTHIPNFGNPWPEGRPQSLDALAQVAMEGTKSSQLEAGAETPGLARAAGPVAICGWGYALGELEIAAAEVEDECGLPAGQLRANAGFESFRRVSDNQDPVSLAERAAEAALDVADIRPDDVSVLAATSATFLALPSLGAALHTRLLLPKSCAVLDVGGACVGLLNSLATASAILGARGQGAALVVASEAHSRALPAVGAPAELRGLFGDGACALVLTSARTAGRDRLVLGEFISGCSGHLASSLEVRLEQRADWKFRFQGESLGRAAVERLARVIEQLERLSGRPRSEVDAFALHEPNPRLVAILAQNLRVPLEKIPLVSRTSGNLGSATCGVGLCRALNTLPPKLPARHPLIFLAAVAPGLLWAGTYLHES